LDCEFFWGEKLFFNF